MIYYVDALAARRMCEVMMPKLRELAEEDTRLVGLLSVEILLSLCSQDDLQGGQYALGLVLCYEVPRLRAIGHFQCKRSSKSRRSLGPLGTRQIQFSPWKRKWYGCRTHRVITSFPFQ